MHAHLVIPYLAAPPNIEALLPGHPPMPALELIAGKGRRSSGSAVNLESFCQKAFTLSDSTVPVAPFTLLADGVEPGNGYWLRADPVHLALGRDRLRLVDSGAFKLSPEEARSLASAFNEHFSGQGLKLLTPRTDRWYLQLEAAPNLHFHPLDSVAGQDVDPFLPKGGDKLFWQGILNETQMLYFEHPVNQAREIRGEMPVNSVWFWGGGRLPTVTPCTFSQIWSDNPLLHGLALAANQSARALPANANDWLQQVNTPGNHLLVVEALTGAAQYGDSAGWVQTADTLDRLWLAPLVTTLRSGRLQSLTIETFTSGGSLLIQLARRDLWRIWRRPRPLKTAAR